MAIHVDCPECGQEYRLRDELAGKKFACKSCQTAVPIPAAAAKTPVRKAGKVEEPPPTEGPEDFDWDSPLSDTTEMADDDSVQDLPALPQVTRKKKPKKVSKVVRDDVDDDGDDPLYRSPSPSGWMIAGMPVSIVISLGCNGVLWLWGAYWVVEFLRGAQPVNAFSQIIRLGWLAWLIMGLMNGSMRARYLSILTSISGLTYVAVAWFVFIPLMALSPLVKEQPWLMTIFYASVAFQGFLCTTDIIALCMPSAAEHCADWEGG